MTDTRTLFTHYRQVKNPNPEFTPREGKKTLPFCRKLMAKAEGFTSRFDFSVHVAFVRSLGKRHRMPPLLRRRAIDALLQGLCFHYDPLANRVPEIHHQSGYRVRSGPLSQKVVICPSPAPHGR